MMRHVLLLVPAVLVAPALAQKVELKVQTTQDQPLRFSIQSKIQTTQTQKMLINGEEPPAGGGRGGRGGGAPGNGESSTLQEIVFDQGPTDANWREYRKLSATDTRPDQEGQPHETVVKGGLEGKKVFIKTAENGVSLVEGEGDKAKPVPAALSRGVPGRVSFAGFLPANAVAVGEEFDLAKTFLPALRGVVHPVTVDRSQNGDAQGGRPGRGGQGGDQGGGDQGAGRGNRQGGGRQGGFGGAGGGANGTVIQLLGGGKLDVAASGKLVSVETKDGQEMALIEVKARLTGKGTNEELGLGAPQGGRQGQGGAGNGTSKVDATFEVTGKVHVNLTQHQVAAVELDGGLTIDRESTRTFDRNGEESKMESKSNAKGKFQVTARCEPAGK